MLRHPGQSIIELLERKGLIPRSLPARVSAMLAGVVAVFLLVRAQFAAARESDAIDLSYRFTVLLLVGSLFVLLYRWLTRKFMWRLRNRLIVTYVFIGVIPLILLGMMVLLAGYLFAGQFSTFVVTTDLQQELRRLEGANNTIARAVATSLRHTHTIADGSLLTDNELFPNRQVTVYYKGHAESLTNGNIPKAPPEKIKSNALVLDGPGLFLRSVSKTPVSNAPGDEVIVVSSVPLDNTLMEHIAPDMGVISIYGERIAELTSERRKVKMGNTELDTKARVTAGTMPAPLSIFDIEFFPFGTMMNGTRWETGESQALLLTVRTRPSLLYNRLFRTLGDITNYLMVVLIFVGVFLAVIEVVALVIGVRLTRTMTGSVAKLYDATQSVNQGVLTHRIEVKSKDQLAALETSFNSMTASLEKLIAEQKEKQRIESELAIAKEVQDLLFPRDSADLDGLELHGVCRPARTVSGDYFDYLAIGPNMVGLAVGDISGKGISAALLMATVHAFVRAYSLVEATPALAAVAPGGGGGGVITAPVSRGEGCPPPGTLLALLNEQLYRSTPAEKYATMFLGFYDQQKRRLCYSNAGHLPPIIVCKDGSIRQLDAGGTVVGLFGGMSYPESHITVAPGDIIVAYSDGITEPENDFGEFGTERMAQIVHENRDLPLPRISDAILAAVTDWIGGEEQPDDMTIVLARAR